MPLTYSLAGAPADIVIDPTTGVISGVPAAGGLTAGLVVTATNEAGSADSNVFNADIAAVVDLTSMIIEVESAFTNTVITLPLTGVHNVDIDWGNGIVETGVTAISPSHDYGSLGPKIITISGNATVFSYDYDLTRNQLRDIKQWGDIGVRDWYQSFYDCGNLRIVSATDGPPQPTSLDNAFFVCMLLTGFTHLNTWDVKDCTNFNSLFSLPELVVDPAMLNVEDWDVSNGVLFSDTFGYCILPEPPKVANWAMLNAEDISYMFNNQQNCSVAPDVSLWNVGKCQDFTSVFLGCLETLLAPDVSGWNMSSATVISKMLSNCPLMTGLNIAAWNVSSIVAAVDFLAGSDNALTTATYDALLISWGAQTVKPNVDIHFGSVECTLGGDAEVGRNSLISQGWIIHDKTTIAVSATEVVGTQGTWLPATADTPYSLTNMNNGFYPVASTPATLWTIGSHMVLGDASLCHWSGTAWVVGAAL